MKKIICGAILGLTSITGGIINLPTINQTNQSEKISGVFRNKIENQHQKLLTLLKKPKIITDKWNNGELSREQYEDEHIKLKYEMFDEHTKLSNLMLKFLREIRRIAFIKSEYEEDDNMTVEKQIDYINFSIEHIYANADREPIFYLEDPMVFIMHIWDDTPYHLLDKDDKLQGIMNLIYYKINTTLKGAEDFINDRD